MNHHCHAKRCTTNVPPEMLMCRKHWAMVPKDLQRAVWQTYRPGQCDDKQPSLEWHDAADAAIRVVDQKERAPVSAPLPSTNALQAAFSVIPPRTTPQNVVGWDTETYLIGRGRLAPRLVCGTWATADGKWGQEAVRFVETFRALLADKTKLLVAHNLPFDLAVMCAYDSTLIRPIFEALRDGRFSCTKIRQTLLDIASGEFRGKWEDDGAFTPHGYQLNDLCERYNLPSVDKNNPWRLRFSELDGLPFNQYPPEASAYALDDAPAPRDIYLAQNFGMPVMYERETCRHAFALQLAGIHGIRSDQKTTDELEAVLTVEANVLKAAMREKGIFRDDGTKDTKRLKALVEEAFAKIQLPVPKTDPSKKFPNGQTSTSADTLMLSGDKTLMALGDGQGPLKLLSTFVPALKAATEIPLQIGYEVLVITGRTSAKNPIKRKKGQIPVGINIQQIPKDRRDDLGNILLGTRNCFVPRRGRIFCSTDYSVAELRALAEVHYRLFGKSALRDALIQGVDPHLVMAATILDKPLEWVVANKKTREVKDARTFAKICNFGLPGGLGAPALVDYARTNYGVKLTLEFAINLVRLYFKTWPEQRQLFAYVKDKVGETQGEIVQLIGAPLRHGNRRFTQASNLLFQGPVAQIAKEALWRVQWEMYLGDDGWREENGDVAVDELGNDFWAYNSSPLFGCRTVAFIHDEILSELPIDPVKRTRAANRQAEVMKLTMAEYLPSVPAVCEPALCEQWDKDAEPVWNKDGILMPWVRPPPEEKKAA